MNQALEIIRKQIGQKAAEVMTLLADVNEMEKTVSRLKNELMEMYSKLDDKLNERGK